MAKSFLTIAYPSAKVVMRLLIAVGGTGLFNQGNWEPPIEAIASPSLHARLGCRDAVLKEMNHETIAWRVFASFMSCRHVGGGLLQ
jgi:hypothetical protein